MYEEHHIAGAARGEPRAAHDVGVRVRVPLSGTPSARWSHVLCGHMTSELVGHPAVGHLHMRDAVQGSEIVLEGVEEPEADCLGAIVARSVEAANAASRRADQETGPANCPPEEAERIARRVSLSVPSDSYTRAA
jgi:hypothetical protein